MAGGLAPDLPAWRLLATRNQPLGEVLLLIRCRSHGERLAMKFMVEIHGAVAQNRSQACAAST